MYKYKLEYEIMPREISEVAFRPIVRVENISFDPSYMEGFGALFPKDSRKKVFKLVGEIASQASIDMEDVLVCCFAGDTDDASMDAVDEKKLAVASASRVDHDPDDELVGDHEGDDSNEANIIARDAELVQTEINRITKEMSELFEWGELTEALKRQKLGQIAKLRERKQELHGSRKNATLPVYYTTLAGGILTDDPESNPLSYLPFWKARDAVGKLAIYSRAALENAGIRVEEKSLEQLRLFGTGRKIMEACVGMVTFTIYNPNLSESGKLIQ